MGNKNSYGKGVNKNMVDERRDKNQICKWWKKDRK
jgi:hypothetical protein